LLLKKSARWVLDVVSVADGGVRELFSSPDEIGRPVWLRGGETLLVPHYEPRYHRAQLWTISFPAGEARRFTNDLTRYGSGLDLTRDGRTLAAVVGTAASDVWITPVADSLKGHQISFGGPPLFDVAENANGKLFAFSGDDELWSMNLDGSQRVLFEDIHDAGWLTPCDRYVAFLAYKPGTTVLTRVDLDGAHSVELARGNLWSPACSPDGKSIFYVNVDQPQRIWQIAVEGGVSQQVSRILGEGICGRMSVSPEGNFLAYPYDQYNGTSAPGWHLAVIPANGDAPAKTFEVPGGIGELRWSPDGKKLQYLLTRDGATNIWEQSLTGGKAKQLTGFTSGLIFDFSWLSDHTKLLLTRGSVSSDVILLSNLH
jgi:WD40 repeat protein